jgi:uncharacterized membrane-anchored protein
MKRILATLFLVAVLSFAFAGSVFADPPKPIITSINNSGE